MTEEFRSLVAIAAIAAFVPLVVGLFRIKVQNVASAKLVQRALAGEPDLQASAKLKPKEIAEYMIRNALP